MTGVNDLPVEVLEHVFTLAARSDRDNTSRLQNRSYLRFWGGEFHNNCAPFVFLRVCSHWRAVAEAIPFLWTPLDATMRTARTGTLMPTEALEHWLSLSKSMPLEFFLQGSDREDDARKTIVSAHAATMLRVLANQAHRWRSAAFELDFHLSGVFVDIILNQSNPGSLPTLKCLEIASFRDKRGPAPVEAIARAIGSIKSLEELYLLMNHDDCVPSLLEEIHWGQLTIIYLSMALTVHQVASFLIQSSAAVIVTFDSIHGEPLSNSNIQRSITLPKLKTLTMNGRESLLTLFDQFSLPSLEQLTVSSAISHCEPLERLLEKSCPLIRQVGLHVTGGLSGPDVAKYLRILRRVPHVEFKGMGVLETAPTIVDELKDEIPELWTWRPLVFGSQCVGWKEKFDRTDGQVIRVAPGPKIDLYKWCCKVEIRRRPSVMLAHRSCFCSSCLK